MDNSSLSFGHDDHITVQLDLHKTLEVTGFLLQYIFGLDVVGSSFSFPYNSKVVVEFF